MIKDVYITGLGVISPQDGLGNNDISEYKKLQCFSCIEPNYKEYIPPIKARRMSRILKMSYVSSLVAMKECELEIPQCINVATSLGCLQDTTKFLKDIIENDEQSAKPTSFINSTHNTIAGLLAISFKSKGQNFTFSHTDFNFEQALLDSYIRIKEEEVSNVLLGGVDELTDDTLQIKKHLHMENQGEGAAFFVLSSDKKDDLSTRINAIDFAYEVEGKSALGDSIQLFLKKSDLEIGDISKVYSGVAIDKLPSIIMDKNPVFYKDFCGDYFTSPAFGLSMAVKDNKSQKAPILMITNSCNSYSFILINS